MTSEPWNSDLEFELREELDRARLENQQLRALLADQKYWQHAAAFLIRHSRAAARRYLKKLRRVAQSPTTPPDGKLPAPYEVKPRQSPFPTRQRILHLIANFHVGGSSRLVVDLIEHLSHKYEQPVVAWDLPATAAYTNLPLKRLIPADVRQAAAVLNAEAPNLIHVHYLAHHRDEYNARAWNWYRVWFEAAEEVGIPIVENVNIPTEPFVSSAVSCYVHVSDYVRHRFGRQDGRHVTIYPGSDFLLFSKGSQAENPENCIGMVYRLQSDKLSERSIEPFIRVIEKRPETRAIIIGSGSLLESFKNQVTRAGVANAFEFPGVVSYNDLPAWFNRMSVFVAPVYRESFGQVSPFAMGMELPVAGYRVGAMEEILGDAAYLATPDDPDHLASIVIDLLDDSALRRKIGIANRRRAEELFSIEAMISSYEALYDELTNTAGAQGFADSRA